MLGVAKTDKGASPFHSFSCAATLYFSTDRTRYHVMDHSEVYFFKNLNLVCVTTSYNVLMFSVQVITTANKYLFFMFLEVY